MLRAERARGRLEIEFRRRRDSTVLGRLYQEGCLKARFPRPTPGDYATAISINSSGGVAPGDRLEVSVRAEAGTAATVTGQAAERFYRAAPGSVPAHLRHHLMVGAAAALEWLPQEAILFDGTALDRGLAVELAADASLLVVEALIFGRRAMGEEMRSGWLSDRLSVRRGGRLVFEDRLRLEGAIAEKLDHPAIAGGGRALATILRIGAPSDVERLRAALAIARIEAGVSCFDGLLLARLVAPDGLALRAGLVAALAALRGERRLPRVWLC